MTTLLLLALLSAPGDAVYVVAGSQVTLSAAQKTALAGIITSEFPTVKPADMDQFYCFAAPPLPSDLKTLNTVTMASGAQWICMAQDSNPAKTDADAIDSLLESGGKCQLLKQGANDVWKCVDHDGASAATKSLIGNFTSDVFSKSMAYVWELFCFRDTVPTDILCKIHEAKVQPPATWRSDYDAGNVLRLVGRVASP